MCFYMIFQKFGHFELEAIFVSLSQKIFDQKSVFLPLSQKIIIFSKIWYQKWILWLISIPEMYTFIYITVILWKLQHSICFKKIWVHTPLINPNTFAGLVGKVRKKTISRRRKEGRVEKKTDPGLEPGTCRVLGEGPQLHARGAV